MAKGKSGAFVRVRSIYPSLLDSEKKIADYILRNCIRIEKLSLTEIASSCCLSKAAVTRFCKHLGYNGFKDFRLSAMEDVISRLDGFENMSTQPLIGNALSAAQICLSNAQACTDTSLLMDDAQLEEAAKLFLSCRNVFLFAGGGASVVAMDFYQKLLRLGIFSVYASDHRMQNMQSRLVQKGDLVCVFDLSGSTRNTVLMAEKAAQNGATVLTICNIIGSPVSKHGSLNLFGFGHLGTDISGTVAPRIALLCIVDCLFNALIQAMGDDCKECIKKTSQLIQEDWY